MAKIYKVIKELHTVDSNTVTLVGSVVDLEAYQRPDMIVVGVSVETKVSTPTSFNIWTEFRPDATLASWDTHDGWRIDIQNMALDRTDFPAGKRSYNAAGYYEAHPPVIPSGNQLRIIVQGSGCSGSAYFTIAVWIALVRK